MKKFLSSLTIICMSIFATSSMYGELCEIKNVNTGQTYSDFQDAIDDADAGETLLVSCTCVGNFTIDKSLIVDGNDEGVLDGGATGTVLSLNSSINVVLKDLTIQNGYSSNGGGIYNDGAVLNLYGVKVIKNTVTEQGQGGGIYTYDGTTVLHRCYIGHNSAYDGGGLYFDEGSTGTLIKSYVLKNNARNNGGGIFMTGDSDVSVNQSKIANNSAVYDGGGIYNYSFSLNLNESKVLKNTAGNQGGGVFNSSNAEMTVIDTKFKNNTPDDFIEE